MIPTAKQIEGAGQLYILSASHNDKFDCMGKRRETTCTSSIREIMYVLLNKGWRSYCARHQILG